MSRLRLFASGLVVAGVAAVALGYAAPHLSKTFLASRGDHGTLAQAAPPAIQLVADKQSSYATSRRRQG